MGRGRFKRKWVAKGLVEMGRRGGWEWDHPLILARPPLAAQYLHFDVLHVEVELGDGGWGRHGEKKPATGGCCDVWWLAVSCLVFVSYQLWGCRGRRLYLREQTAAQQERRRGKPFWSLT